MKTIEEKLKPRKYRAGQAAPPADVVGPLGRAVRSLEAARGQLDAAAVAERQMSERESGDTARKARADVASSFELLGQEAADILVRVRRAHQRAEVSGDGH